MISIFPYFLGKLLKKLGLMNFINTIILNKNWDQHLTDEYNQKDDIVRVMVKPETEDANQERLRYVIESEGGNKGEIAIYLGEARSFVACYGG